MRNADFKNVFTAYYHYICLTVMQFILVTLNILSLFLALPKATTFCS